tara:strand:- start:5114 stop:5302 length:189 start_codon:yes stop_codon:yes gene_type:complete
MNTECKFCEDPTAKCEYLNIVMCFECFKKQMSHYQYDKYIEDLTKEEYDNLEDFMFDIDYKV